MKLPDKILLNDSYAEFKRKVNCINEYLRSVRPVAGPGVRLRQYTSGVVFEAARRTGAAASGSGYDGWFKVEAKTENDTTTIRIYDGGDPESPIAGYAYVNGNGGSAPCAELSPSEGWLCLTSSGGTEFNYQIVDAFPSLYAENDKKSYHVLAQIKNKDDVWSVRQVIRYTAPQLWIFGECDEQ